MTFSFCGFALELLRYIENNWELLVEDIRKGTIDPSIDFADGIRNNGSERYAGPTIPIFARGVAASEGIFSEAFEFNNFNSVIIPDSNFYEFIEVTDGEPDLDDLKLLDELEVGKKYELVITNLSGFYRCRMKDVFLITGKYNNTPTIEYQYRADKTVSLVGEKTTEVLFLQPETYLLYRSRERFCDLSLLFFCIY